MTSTSGTQYTQMKVEPPVSVEFVENPIVNSWKIVIMGPTGAGKSTFIEALGWKSGTRISSGQLDGFTQSVSAYKVNNVADSHNNPVYLLDSPGFADARISEMSILRMLQKWLREHNDQYFNQILYLTPITQVRLPGTHRRVMKTFRSLTGVTAAKQITIVTTMWDTIWGETTQRRAEDTFNQLQNNIWKDLIDEGAQIVKFHNTQESAISILDQCLDTSRAQYFSLEVMIKESQALQNMPFSASLYNDLLERVQNLRSERLNLIAEVDTLPQSEGHVDAQLRSFLLSRLEEVERDLARFNQELHEFGPPPVNHDDVGSTRPAGTSRHLPLPGHMSTSAVIPSTLYNRSADDERRQERDRFEHPRPQRGRFARAIYSVRCWGKAVGEHHVD